MRIAFTKMQGAGNDFVVLNETDGPLGLSRAQYRFLADRHFGVGADQILSVRASDENGIDFRYVIHNADGGEVEHCGNGARCFARYVREQGLFKGDQVKVRTLNNVLELHLQRDGRVTVDMGRPRFEWALIPFEPGTLVPQPVADWQQWDLDLVGAGRARVAVLSMGNPHAVQFVQDVERAEVARDGALLESHRCFPQRVNAGFVQVMNRSSVKLRVYERAVGETLSCGTGACAAVVAGVRLGLLDTQVEVATRGGQLGVSWTGDPGASVLMTGPATSVFEGEIDLPDIP